MNRMVLTVFLGSALVLAGCGDQSLSTSPKAVPGGQAIHEVFPPPAPGRPEPDHLVLTIVPDPATADGCLKAIIRGDFKAEFSWSVNGEALAGDLGNELCEGFQRGDEVRISVQAGPVSASRVVVIANAPPRLQEVSINGEAILPHGDLHITPTVVDADSDHVDVRYQWYINGEADAFLNSDTLSGDRYRRGDAIRFTLRISDGMNNGIPYQSDTLVVPNAPPQFLSKPPREFVANEYRYQVEAIDPDGDLLSYELKESPAGMTIDQASGLIRWPLRNVARATYTCKIVARDTEGAEAFQELSLSLGGTSPSSLVTTNP